MILNWIKIMPLELSLTCVFYVSKTIVDGLSNMLERPMYAFLKNLESHSVKCYMKLLIFWILWG